MASQDRPRRQGPEHSGDRCTHTSSGEAAVLLPPPTGSGAPSSGAQPGQVLGCGAVLGGDAGGGRTPEGWASSALAAEVQRDPRQLGRGFSASGTRDTFE